MEERESMGIRIRNTFNWRKENELSKPKHQYLAMLGGGGCRARSKGPMNLKLNEIKVGSVYVLRCLLIL